MLEGLWVAIVHGGFLWRWGARRSGVPGGRGRVPCTGWCSSSPGVRGDGELLTLEFTHLRPAGLNSWPGADVQEPGKATGQPTWIWENVLYWSDWK